MKLNVLIVVLMGVLFFTQCSSDESNEGAADETVTPSTEDVTEELDYIKMLNEELVSGKQQNELVAATALFNASSNFVNNHPNHVKTPAVMEIAAKSSEAMGKPQQAINILQKLVDEFPETDETPKYIANMARVYEEKLGDLEQAKAMYAQLIERFPEDPLALEADNYVNNFLGKSEAEILMFLDSVNGE